jgi:hypothetical protein
MTSDTVVGGRMNAAELRAYVDKHNLENFVSRAVNSVLSTKPADPWGALAAKLALFCVTKPCFKCLHAHAADDKFALTVVAQVRGASVRVHEFTIPIHVAEELESQSKLGPMFQFASILSNSLSGMEVHQVMQWYTAVRTVCGASGPWPVDMHPMIIHNLACNLLESASTISARSPLGLLQDNLAIHKIEPSAVLEGCGDLDVWDENGWIKLCFTILQSGDGSRVAAPVSVALVTDLRAYTHFDGAEFREKEVRLECMEDFCPALNCIHLCSRFVDIVAQKIAAERKLDWPGPVMTFADPLKVSLQKISAAVQSMGTGSDHIGVMVNAGGALCYDSENCVYQFDSGVEIERTDIVSYWVDLCNTFKGNFITALISPLEPGDTDGYSSLRSQLPHVDILIEATHSYGCGDAVSYGAAPFGLSACSTEGYDIVQESLILKPGVEYSNMAWIFDDFAMTTKMSLDFAMSFGGMKYLVLPSSNPDDATTLNARMFEMIMRAVKNRTEN